MPLDYKKSELIRFSHYKLMGNFLRAHVGLWKQYQESKVQLPEPHKCSDSPNTTDENVIIKKLGDFDAMIFQSYEEKEEPIPDEQMIQWKKHWTDVLLEYHRIFLTFIQFDVKNIINQYVMDAERNIYYNLKKIREKHELSEVVQIGDLRSEERQLIDFSFKTLEKQIELNNPEALTLYDIFISMEYFTAKLRLLTNVQHTASICN